MARESERNESLLDRRSYLKAVGTAAIGFASTGVSSTPATAEDPIHVLSIVPEESDAARYRLTVTEWVRKSTDRYVDEGETTGFKPRTVSGRVDDATVSYEYSGEIRFFDVDGTATIYRDGDRVSPADLSRVPDYLTA